MFADLLNVLKEQVTVVTCRTIIKANTEKSSLEPNESAQNIKTNEIHDAPENVLSAKPSIQSGLKDIDPNDPKTWGKVARNDLCPCGSGKKYKHCHGKI